MTRVNLVIEGIRQPFASIVISCIAKKIAHIISVIVGINRATIFLIDILIASPNCVPVSCVDCRISNLKICLFKTCSQVTLPFHILAFSTL